jgi:hypothetical protein
MKIDILNQEDIDTCIWHMVNVLQSVSRKNDEIQKVESLEQFREEEQYEELHNALALSLRALGRTGFDIVKQGTWIPRKKVRLQTLPGVRTKPRNETTTLRGRRPR